MSDKGFNLFFQDLFSFIMRIIYLLAPLVIVVSITEASYSNNNDPKGETFWIWIFMLKIPFFLKIAPSDLSFLCTISVQHFNRIFEHLLKVNFLRRKIWSFALHHDLWVYCIVEWGFCETNNATRKKVTALQAQLQQGAQTRQNVTYIQKIETF